MKDVTRKFHKAIDGGNGSIGWESAGKILSVVRSIAVLELFENPYFFVREVVEGKLCSRPCTSAISPAIIYIGCAHGDL